MPPLPPASSSSPEPSPPAPTLQLLPRRRRCHRPRATSAANLLLLPRASVANPPGGLHQAEAHPPPAAGTPPATPSPTLKLRLPGSPPSRTPRRRASTATFARSLDLWSWLMEWEVLLCMSSFVLGMITSLGKLFALRVIQLRFKFTRKLLD